jgi:Mg2+-importing ATPase
VTQVRYNGDIVPLDDTMLRRIKRVTDNLNRQGLRVVAVASKFLPARVGDYQRIDESDLILEGYIAFLDPPKETTAPALKALKASGITVKILTGDSELVAAKVCHEVGLDAGDVVVGSEIEHLSDDELARLAQRTTLFARLTPMHKERIVTLLRREGTWWALWVTASTMRRRCVRQILVSPSTARWILPVKRRISFCWKKA